MILVLCVDEKMGLQFNRRRQSRDSAVSADIMARAGRLWIHPFSEKLFGEGVLTDENWLFKAEPGDWCFCEDRSYLDCTERIEKIILYRWNRVYPRDMIFEFPGLWKLDQVTQLKGSSHEIITREVYTK